MRWDTHFYILKIVSTAMYILLLGKHGLKVWALVFDAGGVEGSRRGLIWGTLPTFLSRHWGEQQNPSQDRQREVRYSNLPNKNPERYSYTKPARCLQNQIAPSARIFEDIFVIFSHSAYLSSPNLGTVQYAYKIFGFIILGTCPRATAKFLYPEEGSAKDIY